LNWWIGSIFISAASLGLPGDAGGSRSAGRARPVPAQAGTIIPLLEWIA
jgi:hypothetical protein